MYVWRGRRVPVGLITHDMTGMHGGDAATAGQIYSLITDIL